MSQTFALADPLLTHLSPVLQSWPCSLQHPQPPGSVASTMHFFSGMTGFVVEDLQIAHLPL